MKSNEQILDEMHFVDENGKPLKRHVQWVEWISVKDRLPEDGQSVLAYRKGIIFHAWRDKISSSFGDWYDLQNSWIIEDVTHWMPLPKPPEENE